MDCIVPRNDEHNEMRHCEEARRSNLVRSLNRDLKGLKG
jgi:hypothetical protein